VKYIIGIDGGGTKTEAIAYSLEGEELGRGYAGFGNLLLGFEEALNNIELAIRDSVDKASQLKNISKCEFIYLGLAGIEAEGIKERVESELMERFKVRVKATNDADIALAAMLEGNDGILTISGTGSISYGACEGKKGRTGGWGHLLGDEGSGYFIAMEGFKNMALEEDLGLEKSGLTKAYMNKLEINNVRGIKNFIYSSSKGEIASFAPIVVSLANAGDEKAIAILKQAGRELAIITERLYKKLDFNGEVKIAVKGSILSEVDLVSAEFEKTLRDSIKLFTIVKKEVSPAKGAYYLARKSMGLPI